MCDRAAITPSIRRGFFAAAIVSVIVAALLRWPPIHESLWIDELHTAWCAVGSLDEVAPRAAIGNQSPLFFWLEWLLVRALGPSELSLRLPSLVAGTLLPLVVYLLAARWSTGGVGLVAAVLVCVDPLAIFYSTEARPYALVQLLVVMHMAAAAEMLERPSHWLRALWIGSGVVLFHLHYTAALLVAAPLIMLWGCRLLGRRETDYRLQSLIVDAAIMAVLCLPAVGNLAFIFSRRANWATFVEQEPVWAVFDWWPWALGGCYVAAALIIDRAICRQPPITRQSTLSVITLCWFVIPVSIAWILTRTDVARLFYVRYLLGCFPAAVLFAALCIGLAPWRWSRSLVGVSLVAVAVWSSGIVEQVRDGGRVIELRGEDWRSCIVWLNDQLQHHRYPVVVASGLIEAHELSQPHDDLLEEYCLFPLTSLYQIEADRSDLFPIAMRGPLALDPVAEMLIVHRGGAWLVVRGDNEAGRTLADAICAHLQRGTSGESNITWRTAEVRSFGRVQVLRLSAGP
jgi:mannosyltransferase